MFTEHELAFIKAQRLLRLATVAADGQPDVDAVGFVFTGDAFRIGGNKLAQSRKYRNVAAGNTKVSLILDDLASVQPWTPRGIKIHAVAETFAGEGQFGPGDYLIVRPLVSWSWGIEGASFRDGKFTPHKTIWPTEAETEADAQTTAPTEAEAETEADAQTTAPTEAETEADAIRAELAAAADGLLVTSETDAPLTPYTWPGADLPAPEELLLALGLPPDTLVTTLSVADFFAPQAATYEWNDAAELARAVRFAELRDLVLARLETPQVYRVGEIEIIVLILGRVNDAVIGLRSLLVET